MPLKGLSGMSRKRKIDITDFSKIVSMSNVGGIRAVISCDGIVELEKTVNDKVRKRIDEAIGHGLENIADGWIVEGEFKEDRFYVYYVIDDNKKFLNIDDTIAWASIMGYSMAPIKDRCKPQDIKEMSNVEIRNEREFSFKERLNNILEVLPSGRIRKPSWKERLSEAMIREDFSENF
jgi:hypothetical protein|nr:MAG TPA: hypothetical protein [Caudoviricetes sp.]